MTTTTETNRITIPMSDRRPISVVENKWPIIARADNHDGKVECRANRVWTIRVREHKDGRRLVYVWLRGGKGWRGYLVPARDGKPDDEETIRAIRRVGGIVNDHALAAECILDLPAEEIR